MTKSGETKMILHKGEFIEVDADATSVPDGAEGRKASELIEDERKPGEEASKQLDDGSDPLDSYVAGEENTNSPMTKPWYKYELDRLGITPDNGANAEALKAAFEEAVRSGKKPVK